MSTDTIPSKSAKTIRRELDSDENGTCRVCDATSDLVCDEVAHRQARQPRPTPNKGAAIVDLAIVDLAKRDAIGVQTYGTRLQAHNGRDALRDAYEEALDMALYLRQCIEERAGAPPCPKCSHDPLAPVSATWTFHIPRNIKSGNSYMVNSGPSRWAYAKERDAWQSDIRDARCDEGVTSATGKRRVTITRFYGGRQRELDADNFRTGAKCVVDAIVRERLLLDDRNSDAEIHYIQIRTNVPTQIGTTFTIEELEKAG